MFKSLQQRFLDKITQIPFHECWEWTGGKSKDGYGTFRIDSKSTDLAHRVSFKLHKKEKIPRDRVIDHICRNRGCVNPNHLRLATFRENALENTRNPLAVKALSDKCTNGHLLENMTRPWQKQRICLICRNDYWRKYYHSVKKWKGI